jgi:hypothetical protein
MQRSDQQAAYRQMIEGRIAGAERSLSVATGGVKYDEGALIALRAACGVKERNE